MAKPFHQRSPGIRLFLSLLVTLVGLAALESPHPGDAGVAPSPRGRGVVSGPYPGDASVAHAPEGRGVADPQPPGVSGPFFSEAGLPASFDGDLRGVSLAAQEALQFGGVQPDAPMPAPLRYTPGNEPKGSPDLVAGWVDPVAQNEFGPGQMPASAHLFPGLNRLEHGSGWPPDTNGDVGPDHYVQTVNTSIGIFDKTTGERLVALTLDQFFTGPAGTPCDEENHGDPVVLYDRLEDRWLVTDFAWFPQDASTGPFYECIAVSKSGDPVAGGWWFYALRADTSGPEDRRGWLNDYPKLSVWEDGWYMTANMFQMTPPADGFGVRAWALDKASMLDGGPLREVHFDCSLLSCSSLLPAHLLGELPPPGSPNYLVSFQLPNKLNLWKLQVDWSSPEAATFTGPESLIVADFAMAASVPQMGSPTLLDSLSFRAMMQLQYRHIDGVESLWATHTVASSGAAGVRWYEVRDPGGTPSLFQQGTYQPDEHHRWMGSLAVDRDGNMAVGYSVSSGSMSPAVRYAGRLAGEASGLLPQAETSLVEGDGSQVNFKRWGDYTSMSVDPVDDCTFWYTNEYLTAAAGDDWQTVIGSFKYPSCGQLKGRLSGSVRNAVTGTPVPRTLVVVSSAEETRTVRTGQDGRFEMELLAGTYELVAGPLLPGYPDAARTGDVTVTAGDETSLDIDLQSVPAPETAGATIVDEGSLSNGNGAVEPGESGVLLWHSLLNAGALTAAGITAELSSATPGVSIEVAATTYPDLAPGQTAASVTPYRISLSPRIACGADLLFLETITSSKGTFTVEFTVNAAQILPRANAYFTDVERGEQGWTSSNPANGWGITTDTSHSPTHAWTDSPAGPYVNSSSMTLLSPPFNLRGKRHIRVSGWFSHALEEGYDYVYLEHSLDGGQTWSGPSSTPAGKPLMAFNGQRTEWYPLDIDAPELEDQAQVRLRFRLDTDAYVFFDGFYLDDLAISYEPYRCDYRTQLIPEPPLLVTPADGAAVYSPVRFEWEDSQMGGLPEGYVLYIDGAPALTMTAPTTQADLPLMPGDYTWSVAATNSLGVSALSEPRSLVVRERVPGPPRPLWPADGSRSTLPALFRWEPSETGGRPAGYTLTLIGPDNVPLTVNTSQTFAVLDGLPPGFYRWSLRAYNSAGTSSASPERTVELMYRQYLPAVRWP